MANFGNGILGGSTTGTAANTPTGAAQHGVANGLASGAINGLTDFGNKLQEVQKAFGGQNGSGEIPQAPTMQLTPSYGNNNGGALGEYILTLLNNSNRAG